MDLREALLGAITIVPICQFQITLRVVVGELVREGGAVESCARVLLAMGDGRIRDRCCWWSAWLPGGAGMSVESVVPSDVP